MLRFVRIGLLGISLAACGGATGAAAGAASSMGGSAAAVTALASKLGISENYVNMALSAAQGSVPAGATPTADQKAAAAQAGVDKASAQAAADGKPLSDDQKTGLLDGLKGML